MQPSPVLLLLPLPSLLEKEELVEGGGGGERRSAEEHSCTSCEYLILEKTTSRDRRNISSAADVEGEL